MKQTNETNLGLLSLNDLKAQKKSLSIAIKKARINQKLQKTQNQLNKLELKLKPKMDKLEILKQKQQTLKNQIFGVCLK